MSGLFGGGSNSGVGGGLPTGVKLAAAALLAHQLMKHAQAERGAGDAAPTTGGGGGLGGLLGSLLGQQGGASPTGGPGAPGGGGLGGVLGGLLGGGALGGGLGGLLGGLRDQGLGHKAESWVGHARTNRWRRTRWSAPSTPPTSTRRPGARAPTAARCWTNSAGCCPAWSTG